MNLFVLVGVLGTGLLAGSFLNLVSDRIKRNENFIFARSKCEFCLKNLQFLDLIPVASYLIYKGKCSKCSKKLSPIYPLSELTTALFFGLIYFFLSKNNLTWEYYLFFYFNFSLLLIIFFYDLKFYEIPFKVVVFGSTASILFRVLLLKNLTLDNFFVEFISWVGIFLFYYFIIWVSKGGMGGGDLKLAVYLGIFLGFPESIYANYYAFLIGGTFGVSLLVLKKVKLKTQIPFGPFLVLGSLISLLVNINY